MFHGVHIISLGKATDGKPHLKARGKYMIGGAKPNTLPKPKKTDGITRSFVSTKTVKRLSFNQGRLFLVDIIF